MRKPLFALLLLLGMTAPLHAADTWDTVLGKRLRGNAEKIALWERFAPLWRQVLKENAELPFFREGGAADFPEPYQRHWNNLLNVLPKLSPLEKAKAVSGLINTQFTGQDDIITYGMGEKWSPPAEFIAMRKGDCEDFAIAKYFALRALGFSADDLRLLIVEVPSRKAWHALLAFLTAGRIYIFDNNFNPPELALPQSAPLSNFFQARIAFNENGAWYYH